MTNRERVICTLAGQRADRAPFVWWLGFAPWGETHERWRKESGLADLDLVKYFSFEPFAHFIGVEYGPYPHFEQRVLEQDDQFVVSIDWRGITMRNRRDGGSMPEFIRHPVRSRADWDRYRAERLAGPLADRLQVLEEQAAAAARVDAPVQVGSFPWGVFGTARDLLGAEELLLAFYDEPELVREIMSGYVTLWLKLYAAIAARVQIDHLHIWEDMSGRNGSLISMDMVEQFMMPEYDRIAAFARAHGVAVVSVDSDGDLGQLVPVMMRHGINSFMPFEAQAGCDIEQYAREYPTLGLMGGLDKNALAADKSAIHRELDRCARLLARGGYLPGCDHLIPPNVSWANYSYFVTEIKRLVNA